MKRLYRALAQPGEAVGKLLGELEHEIMEIMWIRGEGTVRDVLNALNADRPADRQLAYTTVMTVMGHLAEKGLLRRSRIGKAHQYVVAETREAFLVRSAQDMAQRMVEDFGEAAITSFVAALEEVAPERLTRLRQRVHPDGDT